MLPPAGLVDNNFEWFINRKTAELYGIYNGQTIPFILVPFRYKKPFIVAMYANKEFMKTHRNIGFTNRLVIFIDIYFSQLNSIPDLEIATGKINFEENIYLKLTPTESKIVPLIITGDPYKIIADKYNYNLQTFCTHVKRILSKTGTHNVRELAQLV